MNATVVACCQLAPVLGDPAANRELAADAVAGAAAQGAAVIVLPELVSSGYVFESQAGGQGLRGSRRRRDGGAVGDGWLPSTRSSSSAGSARRPAATVYNSAALVDAGRLRCVYRKAHLWDRERLWFTPGSAAPPVVATRFGRIAVMICYDLEFPEWVRLPALDGAQLLCAPVNWPAAPRPDGERPAEVVRVQADAGLNRMFIAACDRTGQERGVAWVSGSVIVDADGWPLAGPAAAGPVTITAECRLEDALDKGVSPLSNVHRDRRPELYHRVTGQTARAAPGSGA